MTDFEVSPLRTNTVAYLERLRDRIKVDPLYQRQGEVWSKAKQRLLIDSIINRFDVPKIYFHEHRRPIEEDGKRYKYSLVDGRQRLEAIWDFLDGKFALSEDFKLLEDDSSEPAGKTYSELQEDVPEVAALLAATSLDIMVIRTDDVELIEEMFSRLNEAVPLNAAEKRNGRGGPLRKAVRNLVDSTFFADKIPFGNKRYRHYDLATKFFYWVDNGGPVSTKKQELDDFWESLREATDGKERVDALRDGVEPIVRALTETFEDSDRLLSSIGMVSIYFLLYQQLLSKGEDFPSREDLFSFEQKRHLSRFEDEKELSKNQRDLLEFDRLSQSPNDGSALSSRLQTLQRYLNDPTVFD